MISPLHYRNGAEDANEKFATSGNLWRMWVAVVCLSACGIGTVLLAAETMQRAHEALSSNREWTDFWIGVACLVLVGVGLLVSWISMRHYAAARFNRHIAINPMIAATARVTPKTISIGRRAENGVGGKPPSSHES